jgi:YD repeat-containing protein
MAARRALLLLRYDDLNRLSHVDDASTGTTLTSDYTYNANGSLASLTQPNGIVHAYTYDTLNRLRTLDVKVGTVVPNGPPAGTVVHTYEYKLNPSGHRHQAIEGAKTTTYTYDDLYRLSAEAVAGASDASQNGTVGYTLDKVGNRQARNSGVSALGSQLNQTYNARDWLSGDTYDANGSTVTSSQFSALNPQLSGTDAYDFENRLIVRTKADGSTINISYDADGNRIAKNILDSAGAAISSTTWLVDTNNLTGYAQVFEERTSTVSPDDRKGSNFALCTG